MFSQTSVCIAKLVGQAGMVSLDLKDREILEYSHRVGGATIQ